MSNPVRTPDLPKGVKGAKRHPNVNKVRLVGDENWTSVDPDTDLVTYRGIWLGGYASTATDLVAFIPGNGEVTITCPASQVAQIMEDPLRTRHRR